MRSMRTAIVAAMVGLLVSMLAFFRRRGWL